MTNLLQGGCACGQVRYEVMAEPVFTLLCQCRQCQRITGSGHSAQLAVPRDKTSIHGEIRYYRLVADSGSAVDSGFCPTCGSPILKTTSEFPQFNFLHAATLDKPEIFKPQMLVWSKNAQPWDHVNPSIPVRE